MHLIAATAVQTYPSANATYIYWAIGIAFGLVTLMGSPVIVTIYKATRRRAKRVDQLFDVLLGQAPTLELPSPPPGLLERLDGLGAKHDKLEGRVTALEGQNLKTATR